jgi:tetratricopeptide (TPR) repeat protein
MLFAPSPLHPFTPSPLLVVESVTPDSPAAKAGVKVGDRLLTYDGKPLPSPAALQAAQQNTFGKKEVALQLQHGNETLTLTVPLGALGMAVRPDLPPDVLKLYEEGSLAPRGRLDDAIAKFTAAAKAAQDAGDKAAAAWLYGRVGEVYESQRKWKEGQEAYAAAWGLLKGSADAAAQSRTLSALGRCSQNLNDFPAAQGWYDHAAQVDEAAGNERWAADDLNQSGIVSYYRGNLDAAHDYHTRALKIKERLAPDSLAVAASLTNLGNVAYERGDLSAAHDYHTRALTIVESQRRQIASPEERALLVEQHTQPYTGLLKTYLALNDLPTAFATLERAHARSLVELLNKRQLASHADAPADLLKQQDTLEYQRAAVYRQLAKLDPRLDDDKRGQLLSQLATYTAQQQELAKKIRDAAPKYADLQYPQPLDFQAAAAALDAGTLLLAYYVDEEETYLFVVKGKEGEGRGRRGKQREARGKEGRHHPVTPSPHHPFRVYSCSA